MPAIRSKEAIGLRTGLESLLLDTDLTGGQLRAALRVLLDDVVQDDGLELDPADRAKLIGLWLDARIAMNQAAMATPDSEWVAVQRSRAELVEALLGGFGVSLASSWEAFCTWNSKR